MASFANSNAPISMQIAFVDASTPPFDLAFNKVAAAVTGGRFCHCEVCFDNISLKKLRILATSLSDFDPKQKKAKEALRSILVLYPSDEQNEKITIAFYALQGMPLGVRVLSDRNSDLFLRRYTNAWKVYRIIDAPLSVVAHQLYWALCQVGKPYDTMGALTCPLKTNTRQLEADRNTWFCSNHALRFVQHIALCQDMSLRCTTPNSLEKALNVIYKQSIATSSDKDYTAEEEPSVCDLVLDQSHWSAIEDFVPFVINFDHLEWDRDGK